MTTLNQPALAAVITALITSAVVKQCDEGFTDRARSNNEALVKLVQAGANPIAAQCAMTKDGVSPACVMAMAKPDVAVVSSTRSDELPEPKARPVPQAALHDAGDHQG